MLCIQMYGKNAQHIAHGILGTLGFLRFLLDSLRHSRGGNSNKRENLKRLSRNFIIEIQYQTVYFNNILNKNMYTRFNKIVHL